MNGSTSLSTVAISQGADTVIYERLSEAGRRFADVTLDHLEEFGNQGLRTLCLAYRCGSLR